MFKHTPSPIFLLFMLLVIAGMLSTCAEACESEDDLTDITLKTHYICMGQNWCKRSKN
jgi:hypothetical protein